MFQLNDVDVMKGTGLWVNTMFVPSYFQWTGTKMRKTRSFLGKPIAVKIKAMGMC